MKKVYLIIFFFLWIFLLFPWGSYSRENVEKEMEYGNVAKSPTPDSVTILAKADELTHQYKMTVEKNKFYECIFVSLAVVVSLVIVLLFISRSKNKQNQIVSATGLVFIVFGTVLIVILADYDQKLTGAMGILGAVAGYLFGSMQKGEKKTEE